MSKYLIDIFFCVIIYILECDNMKVNKELEKSISVDVTKGLNKAQVMRRIKSGKINRTTCSTSKTIPQILKTNLFTLFNLINFVLAMMLIWVKSYENTVFVCVAVVNLIIGIVNEIRAKFVIDKLSILVSNKALVIRDGKEEEIDMNDIVLDDIIILDSGRQVVVDSVVLEGEVEVNQSFVTGEEKAVFKQVGDTILSGSFIISGRCVSQAIKVGDENYTSKISTGVKSIKKVNSEILRSFNKLIKIITFIIVPFGLFTFFKHFFGLNIGIRDTVIATVASIDGMIPNGLILLTSTIMAVSVVKLHKYKVLVQELYCIETLARVDVICLDKTGTLTEGKMEVFETIPYRNHTIEEIENVVANIVNYLKDNNATSVALKNKYNVLEQLNGIYKIPFSSKRKFSGATFENQGTFLVGACEFLLKTQYEGVKKIVDEYSSNYRVLVVVHTNEKIVDDLIPDKVKILGFILLQDKIRKNAKKTLQYFEKEGVLVKIISGDSITTITNIANRLKIDNIRSVDMTDVNDCDIPTLIKEYNVFGRVKPEQKKLIINELQKCGHTVAMTGDGVNDVLALKEADCSIAIASGSDAAKNVSQLVLLDSNFDSLPKVVLEGRKTINNIENASSLFLSKTIYAIALVIIFLFLPYTYPFTSLQITLISMLTIGIPSFYLGLQPNDDLVKKGFFRNIINKSLPGGITMILNVIAIVIIASMFGVDAAVISTMCVFMAATVGFLVLYRLSYPFTLGRKILFVSLLTIFIFIIVFFSELFNIFGVTIEFMILYSILFILSILCFTSLSTLISKIEKRKKV